MDFLEKCRVQFERARNGNALAAWSAWDYARHYKIPPPDWVLAYFDDCAHRLLGHDEGRGDARDRDPLPKEHESPGEIGRRLGFSNGLATTRERFFRRERARLAVRLVNLMNDEGLSREEAIQSVGRSGVSRSVAARALQQADNSAKGLAAVLVERMVGKIDEQPDVFTQLGRASKARKTRKRPRRKRAS